MVVTALLGLSGAARAADESRGAAGPSDDVHGPGGIYARIPKRDEFGRDQLSMFRTWNPDPVGNQALNLEGLNPQLAALVRKTRDDNPGLRFVIGSGRRDRRLQQMAFAWGWSRARSSSHETGDAVDLWPLDRAGQVYFDAAAQGRIGAAMKKAAAEMGLRIRWGGYFHGFKDRDRSHFELNVP